MYILTIFNIGGPTISAYSLSIVLADAVKTCYFRDIYRLNIDDQIMQLHQYNFKVYVISFLGFFFQ